MQIAIKGVTSETFVNTVILHHNPKDSLNTQLMRCYKCASNITQVQGVVGAIIAGYIPSLEVPTITRCHKCGEQYTFQTVKGKVKRIKLIISSEPLITTFHCIFCRTQLIQYNIKGVALLPAFSPMKLPAPLTCFVCQTSFVLQDIVERDNIV